MFLKRAGNREGASDANTARLFLRRCFGLIAWWVLILLVMIGLVVIINVKGNDAKVWAGTLFTISCVLDILVTFRAIPIILKVLKDDLSKEGHVKGKIWKLRFLMIANLLFSLFFVFWVWLAKDSETSEKIVKWLLGGVLALGVLFVKCFFACACIKLKRYISKLFVEFTLVNREDPSSPSEATFTPTSSSDLLESKQEEIKSLT